MVPPGGNASVTIAELEALWVVPEDVEWNCHTGPFDLFYIDANLTGPEPTASVGYGFFDEPVPARENSTGTEGSETSYGIVGVELVADDVGGAAGDGGIGCAVGSCGEDQEVTAALEGLTLHVVGSRVSMLSNRDRHGHGHWGHGHWGHRHWGHHHWGHHHGGHRHWGYGHRGWRRGGWGHR